MLHIGRGTRCFQVRWRQHWTISNDYSDIQCVCDWISAEGQSCSTKTAEMVGLWPHSMRPNLPSEMRRPLPWSLQLNFTGPTPESPAPIWPRKLSRLHRSTRPESVETLPRYLFVSCLLLSVLRSFTTLRPLTTSHVHFMIDAPRPMPHHLDVPTLSLPDMKAELSPTKETRKHETYVFAPRYSTDIPTMAEASPTPAPVPYVRAARQDELDALANLARHAFINDPAFNYGANLNEPLSNDVDCGRRRTLEAFLRMLFKMAFCLGARVMVVAVPEARGETDAARSSKTQERLAATCIWMPPGKRVGLQHPVFLLRSGVLRVIRGWGVNFVMRLGFEYPDAAEKAWASTWKEQKVKGSPDHDTWYCQLVCVSPDDQGKGYLSLVMREMFQTMPDETLTLDASNPKARDQYAHLGFYLEKPFTMGKGKATAVGLREKGGPGVELYAMAKWGSLARPSGHKDA